MQRFHYIFQIKCNTLLPEFIKFAIAAAIFGFNYVSDLKQALNFHALIYVEEFQNGLMVAPL